MSKNQQALKMGVVFDGVFAHDAEAVFTSQEHSVSSVSLEWKGGRLRSQKNWTAKPLKHISSLTISPSGLTLLVSDTSGGLAALSAVTGEDLWQAGPIGEGSAPVWINDKLVLHTSWGGHIQLVDAETGGTVNSTTIGFRIHNTGSDKTRQQLFFARGAPPPASSSEALPPDVLCRLEPQDLGVTETPVSQANAKFAVSPSGTTVAIAYQVTSPEFTVANRPSAIRVVDIATGQTIADQILPFELRTYRQAVWSPDEAMICLSTKAGHLFLDAKSLDQRALVERPYACEPKFSNDGKLILLAAWSNACIMPIATIFA